MIEPLLHYSNEPLPPDWPAHMVTREQRLHHKPSGLWLSVGEAWKEWCEGEQFALDCFQECYEVTLRPDANILRMGTAEELDEFTTRYGESPFPEALSESFRVVSARPPEWEYYIDWPRVAREYQGIIIEPYIWSRRLDLMWYYGWDCASGCIWDPKAIASITRIATADAV